MKKIWNYVDGKDWPIYLKFRVLTFILEAISAIGGFLTWILMKERNLSSLDWMICFIGYPIIISWLVIFYYSCNHELHDGKS